MTCSRCSAEAVVKRDAAYYCGKCAMARDWEEIIAIVQADGAPASLVDFGAANPAAQPEPEPVVEVISADPEPVAAMPEPEPAGASAPAELEEEPMVTAAAAASDLPADPFA